VLTPLRCESPVPVAGPRCEDRRGPRAARSATWRLPRVFSQRRRGWSENPTINAETAELARISLRRTCRPA